MVTPACKARMSDHQKTEKTEKKKKKKKKNDSVPPSSMSSQTMLKIEDLYGEDMVKKKDLRSNNDLLTDYLLAKAYPSELLLTQACTNFGVSGVVLV
jgi:hypothetical protein